jgi:outer membrane protein TolC
MNRENTMKRERLLRLALLLAFTFFVMSSCGFAQSTGSSSQMSNSIETPRPFDPATNTTNPSALAVQSQNPYLGSVPSGPLIPGVLSLSLDDAIARALKANLGLIDSQQLNAQARADRIRGLSALLPHLSAEAGQVFQTLSYDTIGAEKLGLPNNVGPFGYQYARVEMSEKILDLSALYGVRAARQGEQMSLASTNDARNIVVLAAASAYLQVAASISRVGVAKAEVESSTDFYHLMEDRVRREVSPDIDLIRAKVAMQTAEQRLTLSETGLEKSKLALARVVGLHVAQQFELTDAIRYQGMPERTLEQQLQEAAKNRSDLQAAAAKVKAAEESVHKASAERLPTVGVSAYYGGYGVNTGGFYGNYSVAGAIKVPIFTGREIKADIASAKATLARVRAEYQDLEERTQYDVRTSLLDLQGAEKSVQVADGNRLLAQDGLRQSQDRFTAGIAQSLEVIEARSVVAQAEDNYISSVYAQNLAKLMLARATGTAAENVHPFLGAK